VARLDERSNDLTLGRLHERAQQDLHSPMITVEFSRDIIHQLVCPHCSEVETLFVPVGTVSYERGRCPKDGHMRRVATLHSYSGEPMLADRRLDQLGLPRFDVFLARTGETEIAYLIAGDESEVLGMLAQTVEAGA
jgi:hypothetical protein